LIIDGAIRPGTTLPSTRAVSFQYKIARNTVLNAYDWLQSEGYIESVAGLKTQVSAQLPEVCLGTKPPEGSSLSKPLATKKVVPVWNTPDLLLPEIDENAVSIDFAPGKINPDHFPTKLVQRFGQDALHHIHKPLTTYRNLTGLHSLKDAIAEHLSTSRGMNVSAEQIIVTAGIQEALNIISRLFISKGFKVAVENPCYQGAARTFHSYGATTIPVDVDADGLIVENLKKDDAKLLYVTPSHQFPTGATLSLERRHALLNWANETGAYIIEDDYDSDYRYDSPPLVSLAGADRSNSVIYLGTVSKSLGPGFRIGYLVMPPALADSAARIKILMTMGHQYIEQKIVNDFFVTGAYQRHLRRIRKHYLNTRDALLDRLNHHFGDLSIRGQDSGMHLMWMMPENFPKSAVVSKSTRRLGAQIHTVESAGAMDFGSKYRNRGLIFGYSSLSPEQVTTGIDVLHRSILKNSA
jgi:GntR family transcriptional regulator/MocR family aminotransferase